MSIPLYVPGHNSWSTSGSHDRNKQEIAETFQQIFTPSSPDQVVKVFEIASGFGVHASHFVSSYPQLRITPTEAQDDLIDEINQTVSALPSAIQTQVDKPFLLNLDDDQAVDKILANIEYDLRSGKASQGYDGVVAINLIHISPERITTKLFSFAQRLLALPENGGTAKNPRFVALYGAYKKSATEFRSKGDQDFDQSLKQRDSSWGLRAFEQDVLPVAQKYGFANTNPYQEFHLSKGNLAYILIKD